MEQRIILASKSPRRKELLEQIGLRFEVITSEVDEDFDPILNPVEVVSELARRKCAVVSENHKDAFVIGADTIVVHNGDVLGKPKSSEHAIEMLRGLNSKSHDVITGVSIEWLNKGLQESFSNSSEVTFHDLSIEVIARYVETGEPLDKAGGYGIQGLGSVLVKSISGSYTNIVGLPLEEIVPRIRLHLGDGRFFCNS
jgi:septum formation protein